MKNEITALFNRAEVFRNGNYQKFSYKNLYVVVNEKNKIVHLDAKLNAEIKQTILDAVSLLKEYSLVEMPLMFNGVEILIHINCDQCKVLEKYFFDYEEIKASQFPISLI